MTLPLSVVVMAAGLGKRMQSTLPKVLHPLAGKPLLAHVLNVAKALEAEKLVIVVGHGADQVKAAFSGGDVIDLRDLLVGEHSSSGSLDHYLHFEKSGSDTVIHVSSQGGFVGGFNAGAEDQRIVLTGVDLTNGGLLLTDSAIVADLMNKNKLITD